jgi:hypothetical protein
MSSSGGSVTLPASVVIGNQADGVTPIPGVPWRINVMDPVYGAKCDGACGSRGAITTGGAVTDANPPSRPPYAGQPVTAVGLTNPIAATISNVTYSASPIPTIEITTVSAHGLSSGQRVVISQVLGAVQANGASSITVYNSTQFGIHLNTAVMGAYTSGGHIQITESVFGYVSNPVPSSGTLTFTIVTAPGGSTPVSVPAGFAYPNFNYYYGTDDTAAWLAAITEAEAIASSGYPSPVTIYWTGISHVSQTLVLNGNVLLESDHVDYTHPDGVNSNSTMPSLGGIIRPHGNFSGAATGALVQIGTTTSSSSGSGSTSTHYGTIDGCLIVQSAVRVLGFGNIFERTYALNGIARAWDWQGSNTLAISCYGGMSNNGDTLLVDGSDCKWSGGWLRQGTNGVNILYPVDFWIGGGVLIFNGAVNAGEVYGNNILIAPSGAAASMQVTIADVIVGGCLGPMVRLAPQNSVTLQGVNIVGLQASQESDSGGFLDNTWAVFEIDSTNGAIDTVNIGEWMANGASSTLRFSTVLNTITGSNAINGVRLGGGAGFGVVAHFTGARPAVVEASTIYKGTVSTYKQSKNIGSTTFSGTGSAASFTIPHNLSTTPYSWTVTSASAGCGAAPAYVTADATNLYVNFTVPPASGTNNVVLNWEASI